MKMYKGTDLQNEFKKLGFSAIEYNDDINNLVLFKKHVDSSDRSAIILDFITKLNSKFPYAILEGICAPYGASSLEFRFDNILYIREHSNTVWDVVEKSSIRNKIKIVNFQKLDTYFRYTVKVLKEDAIDVVSKFMSIFISYNQSYSIDSAAIKDKDYQNIIISFRDGCGMILDAEDPPAA